MDTELKPCPFCGEPLAIRGGVNGYGRCETAECWVSSRAIIVPIDDPAQVFAWNRRPDASQSLRSQAGASDVRPFMFGVRDADGSAYFEEFCVSAYEEELQDAANDIDGEVVALYTRPAPIEITEAMVERAAEAAYNADLRVGFWAEWSEIDEADPANKALKDQFRAYARAALQGETK